MEFICESIDEALLDGSELSGRDVYIRGYERYQEAHFERERKRLRRELDISMPLFAPKPSELIESWAAETEAE